MTSLGRWKTPQERTVEDTLLFHYWQAIGGLIYTEVSIGGRGSERVWPKGAKVRRIDGVRIVPIEGNASPSDIVIFKKANPGEFHEIVKGAHTEVIEIKRNLGRNVMGQVMIGADLMEIAYKPAKIDQVILCQISDPLLEFICQRRNIRVWTPE